MTRLDMITPTSLDCSDGTGLGKKDYSNSESTPCHLNLLLGAISFLSNLMSWVCTFVYTVFVEREC